MIRVSLEVDGPLEDLVEDWFWMQGADSVETSPPHATVRKIGAYFSELSQQAFGEELTHYLAELGQRRPAALSFETIGDQDWQVSWRDSFKPLQIGSFCLVGEWEAHVEGVAPSRVIRIYPGQAFGTGQHATTGMAIRVLEMLDLKGKSVLDIGCGTGILGIVAERLGATNVLGFDIDPEAEENMHHHLAINGTRHVQLKIGSMEQIVSGRYDLVLANITLNVLLEVWPLVPRHLQPGGFMVTTGLLLEQEEAARKALEALGFTIVSCLSEAEWLCLVVRLT